MGVTGRQATMAFGMMVANSWGVPTSVTKRVYFESDAGMTSRPTYVDDASFGQTFLGPADVGDFQPIDVTLAGQMYYDHWTHWWEAAAMGSPAAASGVSSQGAANSLVAYSHVIDLAATNNGRAITVASDKVQFVEEITSAKVPPAPLPMPPLRLGSSTVEAVLVLLSARAPSGAAVPATGCSATSRGCSRSRSRR